MILSVTSNDLALAATYTVTLTVLTPESIQTDIKTSFSLTLVDPCLTATLTIKESILSSNPIEYTIGQPPLTIPLSSE